MHGDTPGHAFALIDSGEVRWYHDCWLAPAKVIAARPSS
jgi:hypothetical protein